MHWFKFTTKTNKNIKLKAILFLKTYSSGPLHMDEQRQDNQQEPTYNSYVSIQDVALKTYQKRWTIEKGSGRGPGRSVLMVRHDDDDDDVNFMIGFIFIF